MIEHILGFCLNTKKPRSLADEEEQIGVLLGGAKRWGKTQRWVRHQRVDWDSFCGCVPAVNIQILLARNGIIHTTKHSVSMDQT